MGQLVFERLFYHHMAGQLQGYTESKNRLFTYIDGKDGNNAFLDRLKMKLRIWHLVSHELI